MTKTVNFIDLWNAANANQVLVGEDLRKPWWQTIMVVPAKDDEVSFTTYNAFAYTSGLSEDTELWCSGLSVEGRWAGPEFIANCINTLAYGVMAGLIDEGDTMVLHDEPESNTVNAVFWIGHIEPNDGRRECNITRADHVLPVRWSSANGFPERNTDDDQS